MNDSVKRLCEIENILHSHTEKLQNMQKELHMLQEKLETTSYANPTSHLSFFQPANTDEELEDIIQNITVSIQKPLI